MHLTIDQFVAELGSANYRFLVPLLVCILIAARSSSLITTDLAMKQFSHAILALQQLGVNYWLFRGAAIMTGLLISTSVLYVVGLVVALYMIVFSVSVTTGEPAPLLRQLVVSDVFASDLSLQGWPWIIAKTSLSGIAIGLVCLVSGRGVIRSGGDIKARASMAVLISILLVIFLHSSLIVWELGPK